MREVIIELPDEFGKTLKPGKVNTEIKAELVRCKDCKHRPTYPNAYGAEINGKWCYWCELQKQWAADEWFCADGKRR